MVKVAALFVHPGGVYYGLEDVDPWDEKRDARLYTGPYPVVAHPPCQRWGRFAEYAWKGPGTGKFKVGDDNGCFESALKSVRTYGGVIEHPYGSKAWSRFALPMPGGVGKWGGGDEFGGRSICVWQSNYGHKCAKPTWLYGVKLNWDIEIDNRRTPGEYALLTNEWTIRTGKKRLKSRERHLTPVPFRDLLLELVNG